MGVRKGTAGAPERAKPQAHFHGVGRGDKGQAKGVGRRDQTDRAITDGSVKDRVIKAQHLRQHHHRPGQHQIADVTRRQAKDSDGDRDEGKRGKHKARQEQQSNRRKRGDQQGNQVTGSVNIGSYFCHERNYQAN